jgi:hypothetical protein
VAYRTLLFVYPDDGEWIRDQLGGPPYWWVRAQYQGGAIDG